MRASWRGKETPPGWTRAEELDLEMFMRAEMYRNAAQVGSFMRRLLYDLYGFVAIQPVGGTACGVQMTGRAFKQLTLVARSQQPSWMNINAYPTGSRHMTLGRMLELPMQHPHRFCLGICVAYNGVQQARADCLHDDRGPTRLDSGLGEQTPRTQQTCWSIDPCDRKACKLQ